MTLEEKYKSFRRIIHFKKRLIFSQICINKYALKLLQKKAMKNCTDFPKILLEFHSTLLFIFIFIVNYVGKQRQSITKLLILLSKQYTVERLNEVRAYNTAYTALIKIRRD